MPKCQLTTRKGATIDDPSSEQIAAAVAEMQTADPDNPACSLSHEHGWAAGLFEGGLMTLENPVAKDGPWHIPQASQDVAVQILTALARGDVAAVKTQAWAPGYGD
jgi:hypothetical protein